MCRGELPIIDAVASDYLDRITFLAVAGSSNYERSEQRVGAWFSPDRLLWGYSDELWVTYNVPYQPVSVLISSDDVIVNRWFGPVGEAELRTALDELAAIG